MLFSDSADDMGLGKTLTIISLILAKKIKGKKEDEKKEEKKLEKWISKTGKQNLTFSCSYDRIQQDNLKIIKHCQYNYYFVFCSSSRLQPCGL